MLVFPQEWLVAIGDKKSRIYSLVSPGKLDVNKLLHGAPAWGRFITTEQDIGRGEKKN